MIPVNEPLLNGREKEYLARCIDTGWISSDGPFVKEFEEKFSRYIGVHQGVAVCNGTAALEAALYGIGIKKGDEVIMPVFRTLRGSKILFLPIVFLLNSVNKYYVTYLYIITA